MEETVGGLGMAVVIFVVFCLLTIMAAAGMALGIAWLVDKLMR